MNNMDKPIQKIIGGIIAIVVSWYAATLSTGSSGISLWYVICSIFSGVGSAVLFVGAFIQNR